MADPGRISASKITTYKGCSMDYFLRYIAHEKAPTNVRALFGKEIHYMLDRFYDVNYKSAENFTNYWRFYWFSSVAGDFLKGKQKRELKVQEFNLKNDFVLKIGNHVDLGPEPIGVFFGFMKLGESILKRFYEKHKTLHPPIKREEAFGKKKNDLIEINGHLVTGVFDRIDKHNGVYYITDYKTDKYSPGKDSFTLHRHPQFTLYSYVFRKVFGEEEKAILYYHLRSGEVFKTHRNEKDFDYLKHLLDEVVEGIQKEIFVPFYGFHCNFCDHKTACEKYCVPHHGGPRIDLEGKIIGAERFTKWDIEIPDWMEIGSEER